MPINATGLDYIYDGKLLEAMKVTLESTFLGNYIWLIFILTIDIVVYLKSRNPVLTSTINLILIYIYAQSLPMTSFLFLIVPSLLAFAGSIFALFR